MREIEGSETASLDGILERLALSASATQKQQLLALLELLERWNRTYNLTAVRDPAAMLVQHVADCLAVVRPLVDRIQGTATPRLLDVGSGAGFPGTVIAVMLPQVHVVCIDSVGKKAAFVRQVSGALELNNLHSHHGRVEELSAPPFDVIASRAFSELTLFTTLTAHLLAPNGVWLAMKGKVPHAELERLDSGELTTQLEPLSVPFLAGERCLVWISKKEVSSR